MKKKIVKFQHISKMENLLHLKQVYWSQLLTKPKAFYKSIRGYDEYVTDYIHYLQRQKCRLRWQT